jgi:hypothetical protein
MNYPKTLFEDAVAKRCIVLIHPSVYNGFPRQQRKTGKKEEERKLLLYNGPLGRYRNKTTLSLRGRLTEQQKGDEQSHSYTQSSPTPNPLKGLNPA